ncbi:sulfite exporter TauE/SafE family protein [Salinifilum aidingensis]
MTSFALLLAFGVLTGVTTALFGFGGGFLTVPVVFGFTAATAGAATMHVAVATSTAVMVVNSLTATAAHARAGRIRREYVWPMTAFIAVGAALGSLAAARMEDRVLHAAFVVYMVLTIVDCVVRSGFLTRSGDGAPRPLGPVGGTVGGIGIGAIASALGVGGSVLTVPLLRRRGLPMSAATSMASPLSAPVAVVATVIYAWSGTAASRAGRIGYVDLVAAAALLCGSIPTIALLRRLPGRIPDRVHAATYLALLIAVTSTMLAIPASG